MTLALHLAAVTLIGVPLIALTAAAIATLIDPEHRIPGPRA